MRHTPRRASLHTAWPLRPVCPSGLNNFLPEARGRAAGGPVWSDQNLRSRDEHTALVRTQVTDPQPAPTGACMDRAGRCTGPKLGGQKQDTLGARAHPGPRPGSHARLSNKRSPGPSDRQGRRRIGAARREDTYPPREGPDTNLREQLAVTRAGPSRGRDSTAVSRFE